MKLDAVLPAEAVEAVPSDPTTRVAALLRVSGFSRALGGVGSGSSMMSHDETELAERLANQGACPEGRDMSERQCRCVMMPRRGAGC